MCEGEADISSGNKRLITMEISLLFAFFLMVYIRSISEERNGLCS